MLRDLSQLTAGGAGILGTNLVGVLASELPTGFPLPGLINNDVDAADPAGCLYRVEVIAKPGSGVLAVDEFGAFSFTGAPDGAYTGALRNYKNGVPLDGAYSFTIGAAAQVTPTVTGVTVTPASATLAGGTSQQFGATVSGTNNPSQAVTWSKTGPGTLTSTGLFAAPTATGSAQTSTITATSVLEPSKSGTATVTVAAIAAPLPDTEKPVMIGALSVSAITATSAHLSCQAGTDNVGIVAYERSVDTGTPNWVSVGNVPQADVPNLLADTAYTARMRARDAANNYSDPIVFQFSTAKIPPVVQPPTVTGVAITPATVHLQGGATQKFAGVVQGQNGPSQALTWSATGGFIDAAGNFTAPAATSVQQVIEITGTSVFDPSHAGHASVTVLALESSSLDQTVAVTVLAMDQQGNPMAGAIITAILDRDDIDGIYGYVAPEEFILDADSDGRAVFRLWPNVLGNQGSQYLFKITNPDTGKVLRVSATVPDEDCYLHQIAALKQQGK